MRTARLGLEGCESFVDDLIGCRVLYSVRDALLHRSLEIQPWHFPIRYFIERSNGSLTSVVPLFFLLSSGCWVVFPDLALCRQTTFFVCGGVGCVGCPPAARRRRAQGWMAEWSKAGDSSSLLFGGVGSNPTPVKMRRGHAHSLRPGARATFFPSRHPARTAGV